MDKINYSNRNVFAKKSREFESTCKKPKKRKARFKFQKKSSKNVTKSSLHMLDTAASGRIENYDCAVISRISDYNSNTYEKDETIIKYNIDDRNLSYVSSISQDADFVHDTSDYQWFADYSFRGDNGGCNNMHTSILSSLCTSYGYNDMARDLDANLAQVDMEDFRTEDIHSFLHSLPQICGTDVHNEGGGEMYASVSDSLMMKYDFDSSVSPRSTSQEDSSSSIYKSELLFSPVKEVPMVSFSIDSLDCGEQDIMLTCQANKDNYTIAFEGSTIMDKSTDPHCPASDQMANIAGNKSTESVEKMSLGTTSSENSNCANQVDKNFVNKSALICSESPYTTWVKLKVDSAENILKRQSSGNNNTNALSSSAGYNGLTASCAFLKSQSLPNLNPITKQFLLSKWMNRSIRHDCNDPQQSSKEFVKIYNLSKSQYGRKIYRSIFENNANFDLISQFINHKHVSNTYRPKEHQNVTVFSSKFSKTTENLIQSSSSLEIIDEKIGQDFAPVSGGCDVFRDSLVSNRNTASIQTDVNVTSDSCSSFSSHSGRVELKNANSSKVRDLGLPTENVQNTDFLRNRYADKAKNFEKDVKKRKLVKKASSHVKAIKIMDRSMQTSSSDAESAVSPTSNQSNDESVNKPLYVMYPNYTLPDLSFLEEHATELDLKNVFLWPQKFSPSPTTEHASIFGQSEERKKPRKKRPCSCPDLETIRNRDYKHIKDWESLMFLLPREYCKILSEDPELRKYAENLDDFGRSLICTSISSDSERRMDSDVKTDYGSTCSTGTQLSSGYRGSSTLLFTDLERSPMKSEESKNYNNRPPLPRGILRNPAVQSIKSKKNMMNNKRYSMFELRREDIQSLEKRRSLPTQFNNYSSKKFCEKNTACSEDEGVDSSGSHCDSPGPHSDHDAKRLEGLLKGAFQWNDLDSAQVRNQNSKKTVSFADRHNSTPPNSPNCSVSTQKSPYQMKLYPAFDSAIHEECEADKHSYCDHVNDQRTNSYDFKKELTDAVEEATKNIVSVCDNEEAISQIALNHLCPALYAVLNHGLKSSLETAFGDIGNSVWQVVEASSQHGLMTRALHELVLRLNNEDVLTEGLLKFNAFVFGLLNVRGLDAWFSYLRTRESVLRKHYTNSGILLSSSRGIMSDRQLTDQLLNSIKPLSDLTFKLDLLYECRQLHSSLMQIGQNSSVQSGTTRTSWVLKKIVRSLQKATNYRGEKEDIMENNNCVPRPRSCVDSSNGFTFNDITSTVRRRWSGIQFGSKLASAFERLAFEEDETYPDSLDYAVNERENESANDVSYSNADNEISITHNEIYDPDSEVEEYELPVREIKFKQLQKRWEMLAEKLSPDSAISKDSLSSRNMEANSGTSSASKSRIPRLVTSPVRPPCALNFSALPLSISSHLKHTSPTSPSSNIPTSVARKILSPTGDSKARNLCEKSSRVDANASSSAVRPNSLRPKKFQPQHKPIDDSKRPASASSRRTVVVSKYVRTLGHRLPSDTGHLSYNDGEKLKVVLDVDDKWILCCRGNQKGLVPRSSVLPLSRHL